MFNQVSGVPRSVYDYVQISLSVDARLEFSAVYSGIIQGILDNFHLPIGYIATSVLIDSDANHFLERVSIVESFGNIKAPELLHWESTTTGTRIRSLLQETL